MSEAPSRSKEEWDDLIAELLQVEFDYDALAQEGYDAWLKAQPKAMAFDTETYGLAWHDEPFCVTVSWGDKGYYFDLSSELSWKYLPQMLRETPRLVAHNFKFDAQKVILVGLLDRADFVPEDIEDTETQAHLLDEHQVKKLKVLMAKHLGMSTDEDEVLKRVRRKLKLKKEDGYDKIPRGVIVPYAIKDAVGTFALWQWQAPQVKVFPELVNLYHLEMELLLVFLDVEAKGMAVDKPYVKAKAKEYGGRILKTEQEIGRLVGKPIGSGTDTAKRGEFNPNAPGQVKEAFEARGVTLESTDVEHLSGIADPLAQTILSLRSDNKMRGTYLIPIYEQTVDGIIHPSFRLNSTRTGRTSSGGAEE